MKGFVLVFGILSAALAEPPVLSNRYLPSTRYLPSREYLTTTQVTSFKSPSAQYINPSASSTYATHSFNQTPRMNYGLPSNAYLPASYARPGFSYEGSDNSEPANYNFQYGVQDAEHGNDYEHEELRQEDNTQGKYSVLLPDGRKQTVQYTADVNGFKPKISYEQVNNNYNRKFNGYANSGYNTGYAYNNKNLYNGNGHNHGNSYNNGNGYSNENDYNNQNSLVGVDNGYSNGQLNGNVGYQY